MSSITWTPRAVASKAAPVGVRLWRAVEAQHIVSTLRLVDSPAEQHALEDIIESTKPRIPEEARRLDYLLFTPFRYPTAGGSRFRAITDPGVFYGAESIRTACAEVGYWRWRFMSDSKGLHKLGELGPSPQTLFEVGVRTPAVDLERPPFSLDAKGWRAPSDYSHTQRFAQVARAAAVGLIRYRSVRDPEPGRCGAVLRPEAFRPAKPVSPTQTWLLTVTPAFVAWQRDREAHHFDMRRWQ